MGLGTYERSFDRHEKLWSHLVDNIYCTIPHCNHTSMVRMTMTIKQYVISASCISVDFINLVRLSFLI